jgi:RNA polymerase sigma factor (sigma-70 family)
MPALRDGDRETIEAVLAELLPDVRHWLHRALGPDADLDDATQDALIELSRALRLHEGRASLRTFAYRVTARVAFRWIAIARRRRAYETPLELVPLPADELDPESTVIQREALKRLYRCLDRMPEKRRMAFVLCVIEGLTPSEAAELEGTSGVTMRSRVMYARREVEQRLGGDRYVQRFTSGSSS